MNSVYEDFSYDEEISAESHRNEQIPIHLNQWNLDSVQNFNNWNAISHSENQEDSDEIEIEVKVYYQIQKSIESEINEGHMIDQNRIQNSDELKVVFDEINCMICFHVVQLPRCCQVCEAIFCKSCINKWFAKTPANQVCPCCRSNNNSYKLWNPYIFCGGNIHSNPFQQKKIDLISNKIPKILLKILSKIKLSCVNEVEVQNNIQQGCEQVIHYEQRIKHAQSCEFSRISCENKECDQMVIKKDLFEHLKTCEYTKVKCSYCKQLQKRQSIETHEEHCLYRVQLCKWCSEEQYLIELENHEKDCFMRKITCNICSNIFYLEQYKDHTPEQCYKELFLQTQRKNQKLQQKNKDLEQENIEMKLELENMRKNQNNLKEQIKMVESEQQSNEINLNFSQTFQINHSIVQPNLQEIISEEIIKLISKKDIPKLIQKLNIKMDIKLSQLDQSQDLSNSNVETT